MGEPVAVSGPSVKKESGSQERERKVSSRSQVLWYRRWRRFGYPLVQYTNLKWLVGLG